MAAAGSSPRSGRPAPSPTRAASVSGRARSQTTDAAGGDEPAVLGLSTAPPATETTDGRRVGAGLGAAPSASASRKAASPSRANSSGTVSPVAASTSASESR